MLESPAIRPVPGTAIPRPSLERLALVCVGPDDRGHRHIVERHEGTVVAFLCGRWRPEAKVTRINGSRRHVHVCNTCYKMWDRLRRERAS